MPKASRMPPRLGAPLLVSEARLLSRKPHTVKLRFVNLSAARLLPSASGVVGLVLPIRHGCRLIGAQSRAVS